MDRTIKTKKSPTPSIYIPKITLNPVPCARETLGGHETPKNHSLVFRAHGLCVALVLHALAPWCRIEVSGAKNFRFYIWTWGLYRAYIKYSLIDLI